MKNKNKKIKKFTLIELVIIIVVIGILSGMALPKFTGIVRAAKVTAMIRDIDTLEKTLMIYEQENNTLPLLNEDENLIVNNNSFNLVKLVNAEETISNDMSTIYESLQKTLENFNDSEEYLYKIDLNKTKDYLSKNIKYGHKKSDKDFFVYSTKTNKIYYYGYLVNGEGEYNHTSKGIKLEKNELIKKLPSNIINNDSSNGGNNSSSPNETDKPLTSEIPIGYIPIYTVQDFINIKNNNNYIQMKSLNFENISYLPKSISNIKYNGNGLKLENIKINKQGSTGIFSTVFNTIFENMRINNVEVVGSDMTGGLIGLSNGKNEILKSSFSNFKISTNNVFDSGIGGIVGESSQTGTLIIRENKFENIKVTGFNRVGGIVGSANGYQNGSDIIRNNYISGEIFLNNSNGNDIGGLIGSAFSNTKIENNYSLVKTPFYNSQYPKRHPINATNDLKNCFFDKDYIGSLYIDNARSAKNTEQMKTKANYIGWDFENIWTIEEGISYPKLKWEK